MTDLFLKIDKRVHQLNDSQAFIYLMIVYCKFQKKQVNRKYLAESLGVTNREYISELITEIEKIGVIKRSNYIKHSYKQGWIDVRLDWELCYDNFYEVTVDFVRNRTINPKTKGFALRYRCLAFDDTLNVLYNKKDLANKLSVSAPTLRKYLAIWNELGIASFFYRTEPDKQELSDEQLNELELFAKYCENKMIKKQCAWYLAHRLQDHYNCVDLYYKAVAGVLFKPIKKIKNRK